MKASASEAQTGSGLALRIQGLQRRPQRLGHGRLQPTASPCVIRIDSPEAITDRGDHTGVVAGTSSSLLAGSGSRSGAISGSDAGSGISMTLTGLLVNPMLACPGFHSSTDGGKAGKRLFEEAG